MNFAPPTHSSFLGGVALLLAVSLSPRVYANGGTPRLEKAIVGPYLVSAWTQPNPPRVGRLHVSVAVMQSPQAKPVLDAVVALRGEAIERSGMVVSARLERGAGGNLLLYHGGLEVPTAGPWRLTVTVEGGAGRGQGEFEVVVRSPAPVARSAIISVVIGALVAGVVLWFWARGKRGVFTPR